MTLCQMVAQSRCGEGLARYSPAWTAQLLSGPGCHSPGSARPSATVPQTRVGMHSLEQLSPRTSLSLAPRISPAGPPGDQSVKVPATLSPCSSPCQEGAEPQPLPPPLAACGRSVARPHPSALLWVHRLCQHWARCPLFGHPGKQGPHHRTARGAGTVGALHAAGLMCGQGYCRVPTRPPSGPQPIGLCSCISSVPRQPLRRGPEHQLP